MTLILLQYVVTGSPQNTRTHEFLDAIRRAPILNTVLIHLDPEHPPRELAKLNSTIKSLVDALDKGQEKDAPNVRVCENFACGLPVYDVREFEEGLPKLAT